MAFADVMRRYPKAKRNYDDRAKRITEDQRQIARQFGKDFFDGDRLYGYGGYKYDGRWKPVVEDFAAHYGLTKDSAILDVGCAKGFMVRDWMELLPGANVRGVDISSYAIENADPAAKPFLQVADCASLPFPDNSFDLVISINTAHNLPLEGCKTALKEMMRVTRKHAFVVLDSWRNDLQRERLGQWNLTGKTIMHEDDWIKLFGEIGYTGDWDWFICE